MRGDQDYTHEMAEQLLAIAAQPLPEQDAEQVKRLVLDYLGVSLRGAGTPWTESLIQWAERYQGTGSATVANSPLRVAPHVAALVNGTAAHGYELDDTHDPSMSHPGAVVISAALAVASETRSSGAQFLSAVAAGYQAMGRLGMAANAGRVMERGFHPTALFGPFGAAVAAVALHGLDAATLAGAWGHALSLTGGSMQFSDEPEGTTVKRLHAGYAASHGVMAAELAKASIGAPVRSLDGKHGFLSMFGSEPNPSRLLREEGERLEIHRISMKPYSCCRLFHSLIDALQEATNDFSSKLNR